MTFPSKLIEDAVQEFSKLPGIGKKTALRLVMYLLNQQEDAVAYFGETIVKMRKEIQYCSQCHNISDAEVCSICSNKSRQQHLVCVVENMREVIAIENTQQFNGLYHVLGGVISPIDGIGPNQLNLDSLINRVKNNDITELIMALNPTMEGDTTAFYIAKQLQNTGVKISTIARGVAFGGELEYTDELTLARSIATRQPYDKYFNRS